jgi:uncharacterized protein (UPF0262 family)
MPKLIAITLDENTIGRHSPNVDHERAVAIYDILEDNNSSSSSRLSKGDCILGSV